MTPISHSGTAVSYALPLTRPQHTQRANHSPHDGGRTNSSSIISPLPSPFYGWSTPPSRSAPVRAFLLLHTTPNSGGIHFRDTSQLRLVSAQVSQRLVTWQRSCGSCFLGLGPPPTRPCSISSMLPLQTRRCHGASDALYIFPFFRSPRNKCLSLLLSMTVYPHVQTL